MQIKTILRLLGLLLMLFSLSMLSPLCINFAFHETFWPPFVAAFSCTFITGMYLWLKYRHEQSELKIRDGFLIVVLFWFVLCFFASLPFVFAIQHPHRMTDAIFESVSGFTTTGASIMTSLDTLPHALLYYRQQLQFLGGMGIVVLAVAILPMLGVGGMQLYRAEIPGPMKDSKLTPRVTQTAKALWFIYFLLTLFCMLAYWIAGMNWFDALGESFATVSTGGLSMHPTSFAYYNNDLIELIACFFMFMGATNFALHFLVLQKKSLKHYWQDEEFRYYIGILLMASIIVCLSLTTYDLFQHPTHTIIKSFFHVISLATTTGFLSTNLNTWPAYISFLMMLLALIGGCAASTSGGIKVLRASLIYKQSTREITKLLHPQAIIPIKFGRHALAEPILQSMWSFISVFIALFLILMLIFMAFGNDFVTSFSAITASLSNTGSGIGHIDVTFANLNVPSKWILIFAMLAGRLEIFSLLILFSRSFWLK